MTLLHYHREKNRQMRWAGEAHIEMRKAETLINQTCALIRLRYHVRKAREAWHIAIGLREPPRSHAALMENVCRMMQGVPHGGGHAS